MNQPDGGRSLRDLQRAVSRHRKKGILFAAMVIVAITAAAFLLPKAYHSEGKLFVRLGRENATLEPTATLSQDLVVAVPPSRDAEVNSVVEILRSRTLAEKVVDALGPGVVLQEAEPSASEVAAEELAVGWTQSLRNRVADGLGALRHQLRRLDAAPELSNRDRAVLELMKSYSVNPVRKSNIIEIDCEGPSPHWAQTVVEKLIDLYQGEHIRLNRPQGSFGFLADQVGRLRRELLQSEEELRDLKTATGLSSPVEQRQALVMRVSRLQEELLLAEAARSVSESKAQVLRGRLTGFPERRVAQETAGFGNEGTDRMRDQLFALQIRKEEAAAKYTEAHPEFQRILQQLDAAKDIVMRQEGTRTQVTTAVNRLHEETQLALLAEEPALASWQAKAGKLREQLAETRKELKTFNENELRIARLEREVELQRASYRKYSNNLEQARVDQAMQEQRMSSISVAEPPTYEPKPIRPRKALVLVFGLLTGLMGGLGLTLLADWRDQSFHCSEDVRRKLNLAVLGSIPRLRHPGLKRAENGKKWLDDPTTAGPCAAEEHGQALDDR